MNIFWLDSDFRLAAQFHNDSHVVKMPLELAQLMCTAYRQFKGEYTEFTHKGKTYKEWLLKGECFGFEAEPVQNSAGITFDKKVRVRNQQMYRTSHLNHPCAVWVRSCAEAYDQCFLLWKCLLEEYTYRYKRQHKCEELFEKLKHSPVPPAPDGIFPEYPQAMPDECKFNDTDDSLKNAIIAYRQYYIKHKRHLASWTRRFDPDWWY